MIHTQGPALDRTVHLTNEWIHAVAGRLSRDEQHAWRALRATLQVLRDRLPVAEAAQLAAQLPALLRGVFWEGWQPGHTLDMRDKQSFLDAVAGALGDQTVLPEAAARAVFEELGARVSAGEIAQVRMALPEAIRDLWPEPQP